MPIYKWVRDEIDKLSYITRTEFKKAIFTVYFENKGKEESASIPYRGNRDQLLAMLRKIRKDINLKERKRAELKKRMQPMIAHIPWMSAGETDGKRNQDSSD